METSDDAYAIAGRVLAPWRAWARPVFVGMERIPEQGPLLFVGNHTLGGLLDAPHFWYEVWRQRRIKLRSLGDRLHFQVPGWGDLMHRFGVVEGNPDTCAKLMQEGASILVFPGGAREVTKRKGERYQLIWKDRMGFARLAVRHRCRIVPFSAIGAEEMYDILVDGDEIMASPLGRLIRKTGFRQDMLFPIVKGWGITPLPRRQRLFFSVREAIDPAAIGTDPEDPKVLREVREATRLSILAGIEELKELRRNTP